MTKARKKWKREDITPEVLRELLHLDEETGKLYWKERGPEWFEGCRSKKGESTPDVAKSHAERWNKRYAGKTISFSGNGFTTISVLGVRITAYQVIFSIYNGRNKSDGMVLKAKNGDISDTRPNNIVEISNQEKSYLKSNHKDSNFYIGVQLSYKKKYPYKATFIRSWLSDHKTPIEAAKAYDKAAFEKWGKHARLNFPEDYGLTDTKTDDIPEGYFD